MTPREKAEQLLSQVKDIEKEVDRLHSDKNKIMEAIGEQHRLMLLQEPLLSNIVWSPKSYGSKYQIYAERKSEKEALGLAELLSTDYSGYHWAFEIEPGFNFRFDDYEVSLVFGEGVDIKAIVKKYNLNISTSALDAEITKKQLELKRLNAIKESI